MVDIELDDIDAFLADLCPVPAYTDITIEELLEGDAERLAELEEIKQGMMAWRYSKSAPR